MVRVGEVPTPEADLARVRLGRGDQLGQGVVREARMAAQQVGLRADPGHGFEVGHGIVGGAGVEMRHQRMARDIAQQHRVAVRRRLRDIVGGDRAAGAGPVLDHEGLAEGLAELGGETPRDIVLRAARRERADDAHTAIGPVVTLRRGARGPSQ
jgi:hypothetical protein